jgi:hypothetical protein
MRSSAPDTLLGMPSHVELRHLVRVARPRGRVTFA